MNNGIEDHVPEGIIWLTRYYGSLNLRCVHLPVTITNIEGVPLLPFVSRDLETIEVSPDNPYFSSKGNCLIDKEGKILYIGFRGSVIPDTVETISKYAFYNCRGLARITIPASVKKIEKYAFEHCSDLTEIELPEGLLKIGRGAFRDCTSLVDIVIPESVTEISEWAFEDCPCKEAFEYRTNK